MVKSLVTVVVPIYNVEKYLNRCIESIVKQSYNHLEIILVDDGSPDNCPTMCDEWQKKDTRIKVIHKNNAGLGMARNTGIENASGDYIFFIDSDDYVDTLLIEKCVASAIKYGSDAVIYGRYDVYDDGRCIKKDINSKKDIFVSHEVTNELLPAMFTYDMGFGVSAWGKMFSLDVFRDFNMRFVSEREIVSEDAFFSLGFFSHSKVVSIVNECLYFYCKRENSLSRAFRLERHIQNDEFLKKSLDYSMKANLSTKVIIHLKARYQMYVIASMKQLMTSDLSKNKKLSILREIFHSNVLRASIDFDVMKVQKTTLRLFFIFLKLRCYLICRIILCLRIKRVKRKISEMQI